MKKIIGKVLLILGVAGTLCSCDAPQRITPAVDKQETTEKEMAVLNETKEAASVNGTDEKIEDQETGRRVDNEPKEETETDSWGRRFFLSMEDEGGCSWVKRHSSDEELEYFASIGAEQTYTGLKGAEDLILLKEPIRMMFAMEHFSGDKMEPLINPEEMQNLTGLYPVDIPASEMVRIVYERGVFGRLININGAEDRKRFTVPMYANWNPDGDPYLIFQRMMSKTPVECVRQVDEGTIYGVWKIKGKIDSERETQALVYVFFKEQNGLWMNTEHYFMASKKLSYEDTAGIVTGTRLSEVIEIEPAVGLQLWKGSSYGNPYSADEECTAYVFQTDGILTLTFRYSEEAGEMVVTKKNWQEGFELSETFPALYDGYEAVLDPIKELEGVVWDYRILDIDFPE